MTTKKKAVAGGAVAAVILGGAALMHNTSDLDVKKTKPGYELKKQSDGKFEVYETDNGKHRMLGKDLTPEQADQFLDKEKGRHQ